MCRILNMHLCTCSQVNVCAICCCSMGFHHLNQSVSSSFCLFWFFLTLLEHISVTRSIYNAALYITVAEICLRTSIVCRQSASDESNFIRTTSWLTINLTVNNSVSTAINDIHKLLLLTLNVCTIWFSLKIYFFSRVRTFT